jgi:hypothetical protein
MVEGTSPIVLGIIIEREPALLDGFPELEPLYLQCKEGASAVLQKK